MGKKRNIVKNKIVFKYTNYKKVINYILLQIYFNIVSTIIHDDPKIL